MVSVLLNAEKKKGAPLTEEEVVSIRDNAAAIALPEEAAKKMEISRGYTDIDATNVWEAWQRARVYLVK